MATSGAFSPQAQANAFAASQLSIQPLQQQQQPAKPQAGYASNLSFPTMDLSGKLVIKARLEGDDDIRRIPINNEDITYDELLLMMQRVFRGKLTSSDEVTAKYRDEDGDYITIMDDADLSLAKQSSRILDLKLRVQGRHFGKSGGVDIAAFHVELTQLRDRINTMLATIANSACQSLTEDHMEEPYTAATTAAAPAPDPAATAKLSAAQQMFDPLKSSQTEPAEQAVANETTPTSQATGSNFANNETTAAVNESFGLTGSAAGTPDQPPSAASYPQAGSSSQYGQNPYSNAYSQNATQPQQSQQQQQPPQQQQQPTQSQPAGPQQQQQPQYGSSGYPAQAPYANAAYQPDASGSSSRTGYAPPGAAVQGATRSGTASPSYPQQGAFAPYAGQHGQPQAAGYGQYAPSAQPSVQQAQAGQPYYQAGPPTVSRASAPPTAASVNNPYSRAAAPAAPAAGYMYPPNSYPSYS